MSAASSFCTNCGSQVTAGTPFCTNCGTRIGTPARTQHAVAQASPTPPSSPSPPAPAFSLKRLLLAVFVVVVVIVGGLFVAIRMTVPLPTATPAASAPPIENVAARAPEQPTQPPKAVFPEPDGVKIDDKTPSSKAPSDLAPGLALQTVMGTLFGNVDPRTGGSSWSPQGLPGDLASLNGRVFFVTALSAQRYVQNGNHRILVLTRTHDLEESLAVVADGDGCHGCSSWIGLALFEQQPGASWKLVVSDKVVTSGGSWGSVPSVMALGGSFSEPTLRIEDGYLTQGEAQRWEEIATFAGDSFVVVRRDLDP